MYLANFEKGYTDVPGGDRVDQALIVLAGGIAEALHVGDRRGRPTTDYGEAERQRALRAVRAELHATDRYARGRASAILDEMDDVIRNWLGTEAVWRS